MTLEAERSGGALDVPINEGPISDCLFKSTRTAEAVEIQCLVTSSNGDERLTIGIGRTMGRVSMGSDSKDRLSRYPPGH